MKKYLLLLLMGLLVMSCADDKCSEPDDYDYNSIKICGLFSMTENLTELGQDSKVAMEVTVDKLMTMFNDNQNGKNIIFKIEDTQLNPDRTLEIMKARHADGYNIFIGPSSSSEVTAVKAYADANNLLVISHYSTAGSLSLKDNIFRYCPNEVLECSAMTSLLVKNGVKAIVPIYLDDTGNAGLYTSLKQQFQAANGKVYSPATYTATEPDYAKAVTDLRSQLINALDAYGTDEVAIYYAGFSEMNSIFELVAKDNIFSSVVWYAGDGITKNSTIFESTIAMEFARKIKLISPIMGCDETLYEGVFENGINDYAVSVADATWNAVMAASKVYENNITTLKTQFITESNRYFGYSGNTELDENGDRKYGLFDFYQVEQNNWIKYASFNNWTNEWVYY